MASLQGKFKEQNTNSEDMFAITIKLDAYPQMGSFTLINVYDSYKANKKAPLTEQKTSTIKQLLDFIANSDNLGEIFLCGSFDARTADINNEHKYYELDHCEVLQ